MTDIELYSSMEIRKECIGVIGKATHEPGQIIMIFKDVKIPVEIEMKAILKYYISTHKNLECWKVYNYKTGKEFTRWIEKACET